MLITSVNSHVMPFYFQYVLTHSCTLNMHSGICILAHHFNEINSSNENFSRQKIIGASVMVSTVRGSIVQWRSGLGFQDGAPLYWIMQKSLFFFL